MKDVKIITFPVEEQLKAKTFCESIPPNAVTFMVQTMLSKHYKEFEPYLIKLGGDKK